MKIKFPRADKIHARYSSSFQPLLTAIFFILTLTFGQMTVTWKVSQDLQIMVLNSAVLLQFSDFCTKFQYSMTFPTLKNLFSLTISGSVATLLRVTESKYYHFVVLWIVDFICFVTLVGQHQTLVGLVTILVHSHLGRSHVPRPHTTAYNNEPITVLLQFLPKLSTNQWPVRGFFLSCKLPCHGPAYYNKWVLLGPSTNMATNGEGRYVGWSSHM